MRPSLSMRRRPGVTRIPEAPCDSVGFVSAAAYSAALAKRSAGIFESAVFTANSTSAGTDSRSVDSGVGFSVMIFETTACTVDPANGGSPAIIS